MATQDPFADIVPVPNDGAGADPFADIAERGWLEQRYDTLKRGLATYRLSMGVRSLYDPAGNIRERSPEEMRDIMSGIADAAKMMRESPTSDATNAANAVREQGTFSYLKALAKNPSAIVDLGISGTTSSIDPIAMGAAGFMIGGPYEAAAGAAVGTGMQEVGFALLDYLTENGVDVTDQDQLLSALSDKEKVGEAVNRAMQRAAAISAVNAVTMGTAGKLITSASKAGRSVVPAVLAEGAIQTAGEGLGEGLAQVVSGQELSGSDIVDEMLGGFGQNAVEMAQGVMSARDTQDTKQVLEQASRAAEMAEAQLGEAATQAASDIFQSVTAQAETDQARTAQTANIIEAADMAGQSGNTLADVDDQVAALAESHNRAMQGIAIADVQAQAAQEQARQSIEQAVQAQQEVEQVRSNIQALEEVANQLERPNETEAFAGQDQDQLAGGETGLQPVRNTEAQGMAAVAPEQTGPAQIEPAAAEPAGLAPAPAVPAGIQPGLPAEMRPAIVRRGIRSGLSIEQAEANADRLIQDQPIFNLTEDIPGHPAGSTVTAQTLEQAGYALPQPEPANEVQEEIPQGLQEIAGPLQAEPSRAQEGPAQAGPAMPEMAGVPEQAEPGQVQGQPVTPQDGTAEAAQPEAADPAQPSEKQSQVFGVHNIGHTYAPVQHKLAEEAAKNLLGDMSVSKENTEAVWTWLTAWASPDSGLAVAQHIYNSFGNALVYGKVLGLFFDYALKSGDSAMLDYVIQHANTFPMPAATASEAAYVLGGRSRFENPLWDAMYRVAEAKTEAADEALGKKGAADEVRKAVNQTKPDEAAVEAGMDAAMNDIDASIEGEATPSQDPSRPNRTAMAEIERRVRQITDKNPSAADPVRAAIEEQKNNPIEDVIFAGRLEALGVDRNIARNLAGALRVYVDAKERAGQLREMFRIAKGDNGIGLLVQRILGLPANKLNSPDARRITEIEFFMERGLSEEMAIEAQQIFDSALIQTWGDARAKAAREVIETNPKWNQNTGVKTEKTKTRIRTDLESLLRAVRAGLTDPTMDWEGELAKTNGWKGFTSQQHERLAALDGVIRSESVHIRDKRLALDEVRRIVADAQMPPSFGTLLVDSYTASMFSGLPTATINVFGPQFQMVRDTIIDVAANLLNPLNAKNTLKAFFKAERALVSEFGWAWKHGVYMFEQNELLAGANALEKAFAEGVDLMFNGKTAAARAEGFMKFVAGSQKYVFKWMSAADQASRAVQRQFKTEMYSSLALKEAGYTQQAIDRLVDSVYAVKEHTFESYLAKGYSKNEAAVRANDAIMDEFFHALEQTGKPELAGQVAEAARKDADAMVGLLTEGVKNSDEGFLRNFLWINSMLDAVSKSLRSNAFLQRLSTRMIFGAMAIPTRVLLFLSNFGPGGLVRYAIWSERNKRGYDTLWKQTYANHIQAKQRFREALAGTFLMTIAPFFTSRTGDDDDEDKNRWAVFVTGNGPDMASDPVYADAWRKRYGQNNIIVRMAGQEVKIPVNRAGEAIIFPLALTSALDDFSIKHKQNKAKRAPTDLDEAAFVTGKYLETTLVRGIFASYRGLGALAGSDQNANAMQSSIDRAAFVTKSFLPWNSMMGSVARIVSSPIDRSTIDGVIWSSTPVIGPIMGKPAINALGDEVGDMPISSKVLREGLPVSISINPDKLKSPAYEVIMRYGAGPSSLKRAQVEAVYGPLDMNQWYDLTKLYGTKLRGVMEQYANQFNGLNAADANQLMDRMATSVKEQAIKEYGLKPYENIPFITKSAGEVFDQLKDLPPEQRNQEINRRAMAGDVPLLNGQIHPAFANEINRLNRASAQTKSAAPSTKRPDYFADAEPADPFADIAATP